MWKQDGIAPNAHFRALLYNEPAETLVACFERIVAPTHSVGEIYTRKRGSSGFAIVPGGGDLISYLDPISCSAAPYLFHNVWRHDADHPSGADWDSVRRCDLRSGEVSTVVSHDTIAVPSGHTRAWISALHSVDPDGNNLICSIGFEMSVSDLAKRVDYWLCALPTAAPAPQKIALLLDTFF